MHTSTQWIDKAKKALHIASDRALSTYFGWNRSTPVDIRSGKKQLNNKEAANIADVLHVNPLVVIADAETERAKTPAERAYWMNAAKKSEGIDAKEMPGSVWTIPSSHVCSLTRKIVRTKAQKNMAIN